MGPPGLIGLGFDPDLSLILFNMILMVSLGVVLMGFFIFSHWSSLVPVWSGFFLHGPD